MFHDGNFYFSSFNFNYSISLKQIDRIFLRVIYIAQINIENDSKMEISIKN